MSSVYPGTGNGDAAYPPPNPAVYNPSAVGAPPPYAAAAGMNPQMNAMGMGGFGTQVNYEWGTFSGSGLDLLNDQQSVNVNKLFNQEEAITYIDRPRRFAVTNDGSQQMFSLVENEDTMPTHAAYRSFEVDAFDATGQKAFTIIREETSCCSYCCFCCTCFGNGCRTKVKVKVNGRCIGSVNQDCSFNSPEFTIYSGEEYDGEELLKISGSTACCTPATCFGLKYPKDSSPSGDMRKKGPAFGTLSNSYTINFPTQSNSELKALCIASIVLFDYRFYNRPVPKNGRRRR